MNFLIKPLLCLLIILSFVSSSYSEIKSLVSVAPNITEIINSLGMSWKLRGITEQCKIDNVKNIEYVGSYLKPNIEKIYALNPEIVMGVKEGYLLDFKNKLDKLKIPNKFYKTESYKDIIYMIEDIAYILNVKDRSKIESLKQIYSNQPMDKRYKGLFIISAEPLIAAGGKTFLSDIMECGGVKNILKDSTTSYPKINSEFLFSKDINIIITSKGHADATRKKVKDILKDKLNKNVRLLTVDDDIFLRASFGIGEACLYLRKELN